MRATAIRALLLLSLHGCTSPPEYVTTGENGSPCANHLECISGRCIASLGRCTNGQVGSLCAGDPDCNATGSCVLSLNECTNGVEGSACDVNEQCTIGCVVARQQCTGGAFDDPCDDVTDCAGGYHCGGGHCVEPCRSDCDCPSSEHCYHPATGPWYCEDNTAASSNVCFVNDIGRSCSSSATCSEISSGYCAGSGFCTRECASHWNCGCPSGTTDDDVEAFLCDAACLPTEGGGSYCFPLCERNADCPSGLPVCSIGSGDTTGVCVP